MKYIKQAISAALVASMAGTGLATAPAAFASEAAADTEVVSGAWEHHKTKFNYFGITSLYTCYGLEDRVKSILLHFGARKDVKVSAVGCPLGPDSPSNNAFVEADFYTLAPATDSVAPDAVKARFTAIEIGPRRPYFMGDGDCELVEQMKDLIAKNFTLRDVKYRTDCVPHQLQINGFDVKARALKAIPIPAPQPSAEKS